MVTMMMRVKAIRSRKLRLCVTVGLQEFIAGSINGFDIPWLAWVGFKFTAQLENMDIDGAVEAVKIMPQRFFDNLRPTEHAARLFNEHAQHFKFDRGQVQGSAIQVGFMF